MLTEEQITCVRKEFEELAQLKYKALEDINFAELDLNIFVLKLMNLKTADEIAEFVISQRVERSLVTTYGVRAERIAKILSRTPDHAGPYEILIDKHGKKNVVYMKAGPHSMDRGLSTRVKKNLENARIRDPEARVFMGITYGNRMRAKKIVERYSDIDWLMGREFWEHISDDPECARKVFEVACEVAENYRPPGVSLSYRQLKLPKVKEISDEMKARYGEDEEGMWQKMFDDFV